MNKKVLAFMPAFMLALFLLSALFSLFNQVSVAHAATFVVNISFDEDDGTCDIGGCSIRDAIAEATDGDDITIPAGSYTLSATNGTLTVSESLTFNGNSATDTFIDAQGNSRVFNVTAGTATFNNLTIQGGVITGTGGGINATGAANLNVNSSVITGNEATTNGGGIAFTNGTLTLVDSQIISNTAGNNGGGVFSNNGAIAMTNTQVLTNTAVGSGGGIALNLSSATLEMNSGQINGNSASMAVNSFPGGGVFIAQGTATIHDGEIRNNVAHRGGGILVSSGTLTFNGGQIIDNEADYGGGIYVRNPSATATINGGQITQNRAVDPTSFGGGGLYIFQGLITLNGGEISQNNATNDGGGMEIGDPLGRFTQTGGAIHNNSAGNMGGAIHNSQGTLNISGGMIYSNTSGMQGGGIYASSGSISILANSSVLTNTSTTSNGGGIDNNGSLTMTNVTLGDNNANSGAGLWNSGSAVLTNVTLSENSATTAGGGVSNSGGTVTVGNSIIYGNTAPADDDCSGTISSAGNNISSCGGTDLNSDPLLAPLALNGSSTLNYALGTGSPALDAGSNALCPNTDQRGNLRPIDGDGDDTATCDIGAYEWGIGFFIGDVTLAEGDAGNSQMHFTVSRSFITNTTYTVDYATVTNTATADDFTAVPTTTLTFNPGDITQTVTITISGDTLDEEDEQFTVRLGNQSSEIQVGDFGGTGTILDDDAPPSLTIADITVTEGDAGAVTAVFTATLSDFSGKTITVDYATTDGTAESADQDYVSASDTITFSPGTLTQTISIDVLGDSKDEFDETFTMTLSSETNVTLADSSAQATITDDDAEPTLSIANGSITEGNSGTTTLNLLVSADAPSGKPITVTYQTADVSAAAGSDYVSANNTLTFVPGDIEETVSITVNGDTIDEMDETFQVNLSGATNATISGSQAVGTITDNDLPPTATIQNATVSEGDSGTVMAEFTVTLSAASEKIITINYSSANDTAIAGADFTAVSATLTFNPGAPLSQTISVTVQGDELSEQDETFFINLTGSSNVTLSNSQATGTINNDDGFLIFLPFVVKP